MAFNQKKKIRNSLNELFTPEKIIESGIDPNAELRISVSMITLDYQKLRGQLSEKNSHWGCQGCLDEQTLLDLLDFKSSSDQLIFLGDLINRGPKSLEVLEFLYSMDHCVLNTLGNHDLHLLALTIGNQPYREKDHSIKPILESKK